MRRVKYKYSHWFLRKVYRFPRAMTLGHTIIFKHPKEEVSVELIAHELVHVEQIERMGFFKFYLSYLWLLLRHGYRKHPYELEAIAKSGSK